MTEEQVRLYMLGFFGRREAAAFEALIATSPTIALEPSVAEPDEFVRKLKRYYPDLTVPLSNVNSITSFPPPIEK